MKAQYVARFNVKGKTHKIRDGWSYDAISKARTGCGAYGAFTVEHLSSGTPLPVTCARRGCDGGE